MKTTWTSQPPLKWQTDKNIPDCQKLPFPNSVSCLRLRGPGEPGAWCLVSLVPGACWWSLVGKFWRGSELLAASATDPQQQGPCQGLFFIGSWGRTKEEKEKKHSTDFSCMACNPVAWILWLANWSSLGCLPCTIWGRKKRCKGKTGSRFNFFEIKKKKEK